MSADLVYEGARSITGPLLASLGASAFVVGIVIGAGEAVALVLRLLFGTLADRTGSYWSLTMIGYGMTAVAVPMLAVTPFLGAAGLAVACVLILVERLGKAIRSPSKSALLALAAENVGRGRGFGVHKALDQLGAFTGPLLVAGVVAATARIWPAMAVLAIPGILAMVLLSVVRARMPMPAAVEVPPLPIAGSWIAKNVGADLPRSFFIFAAATALTTAGLVGYGLIGFHLTTQGVVRTAAVPVLYALAMAAAAVAALVSGWVYDRRGGKVLYALPLLVAAAAPLVFSQSIGLAASGVVIWGGAVGLQDSTVKALVADLVPAPRRATAFGVFAAIQGGAAVIGGGVAGLLYTRSIIALVMVLVAVQAVALILLVMSSRDENVSEA